MRNLTRHLRVVTALKPPFVMYNQTDQTYYGFCIDLLLALQQQLHFTFDIKESADKQFGHIESNGKWTGMIKDLITDQADVALGALWITADRSRVVDFTCPFYEQNGFRIMMKQKVKRTPFMRFIVLLDMKIWISFALSYTLTSILLCVFERYSPESYTNSPEMYVNEPDDRFKYLKECFWFTLTSITPQGGGDIPKNYSGKLAAATWWLLSFVVAAVYCANLAAYQTLARLEKRIETMEDLRRQYYVPYTTLANSPTVRYFETMARAENIVYETWKGISLNESIPEWERTQYTVWEYPFEEPFLRMSSTMREHGYMNSTDEVLKRFARVRRKDFAFISETMTIKYLMMKHCGFKLIGKEFGKKPYGIAVQKGSDLRESLTEALTYVMSHGIDIELKKKWWEDNPENAHCPPLRHYNAGLGMEHFAAIFCMILFGISLSAVVMILQFIVHCIQKCMKRNPRLFKVSWKVNESSDTTVQPAPKKTDWRGRKFL